MESNKLDKFFKDKLDQRPIEWDESYWASAQEALDVADQRKRRRGFLGWWMLLGFLILAGFGAWLLIYLPFGSTTVTKLENPSTVLENKTRSTAANPAEQVAEYSVAGNQALTQKEALVDSNTEIVEAGSTVTTAAQDAEAHTISKDIPATAPLRETPETSKPAPIAPAGDSSVPSKSSQNSIQGASSTPITGQPSVVEQEMPSAATDSKETTEATPLPKTGQKTLPADYLPLLAYSVIWQATQPTLAIAVAEAKPGLETAVQPVQHKWHLGLSLNGGLALLQGAADRSILQKTLSGGVLIQRKLAGQWYLSSGLSYQASFAAYDSIAVVPQYEMSFGLDRNEVLLRPTILHRVQLPLGVQYAFPKGHALEVGAQLALQFGAHGGLYAADYLYPWERTEAQNNELERELQAYYTAGEPNGEKPAIRTSELVDQGWLGREDLNLLPIGLYLNYRYQVTKALELGLEANYGLQPLFKEGAPSGLGLGLRINYWLF